MNLRNGCGWSISSLLLLSACSSKTPSENESGITSRSLALNAQTVTTQMTLPSTLSSAGFLVAQTKVQIDSGVTVNGAVWSAGTFSMQPDAKAQTVTCTGNVVLADRDSITTLTTGGTISQGNGDVIGSITKTKITNVTTSTTVAFPAASQTINLSSGQSKTLNPGSYVGVTASSGATLTLLAGDYFVSSLTLESAAVLKLSPTQGATRIFIASSFTYRPTLATGADASRFFVEYLGTNPVVLETPFFGSIVVPRASLTIGTANGQTHRGSFMAQSIEVQANAKLTFVLFNAAGTISSCATGTWDPDGNPFTPCLAKTTCTPGSYVSNEGTTTSDRTCTGCTSGQFSKVNNAMSCTAWTNCQAGTYVSNSPSSTVDRICVACPAGMYSSGNNQSQCLKQGTCAAGTVQIAAGTPTSPPVCSACVAGQYCAGGTNPQTTCAPGTWDNDSDPATACVAKTTCIAGSYVASEGTTTADRTCASCASGTFSTASDAATCTVWTACLAGSYVTNTPSTTVDRVCSACPTGQYSNSNNQTSCQPQGTCAAGTVQTVPGTATSAAVCDACLPGNYCAGGTSPQMACAADAWDQDGSAATPCVARTSCLPGTWVASEGNGITDRSCTSCDSGHFSTTVNAGACTPWSSCAAGTFVSNTPSATADRVCAGCPSGQYSSGANQSSCQDQGSCAAGTVQTAPGTATGAAVCEDCVAGQFCAGGTSPQTTCASGTWDHDTNSATACAAVSMCAPGSFVTAESTPTTDRTCMACTAGSFSTTANASACVVWMTCEAGTSVSNTPSATADRACTTCATGQFSATQNAEACTPWSTCIAGSYVSNVPSSTVDRACTTCASGQFSSGDNQSTCVPQGSCAAGTVQVTAGTATSATVCSACNAGDYCAGGTSPQAPCATGTWDHDGNPATACVAKSTCIAGTYVASEGSTTTDRGCTSCANGQFSTGDNAPSCTEWRTCAAGTFVWNTPSATVNRVCSPCDADKFSTTTNAASCTPVSVCSAGTYVSASATSTSDAVCSNCATGTFSTVSNAPACTTWSTCPTGTVITTPGTSTSNVVCGPIPGPVLTDSLVLLLHMEESSWSGAANEVIDSSALGNHGVAVGSATTTSVGKFGRGGLFDGSGSVTVADAPSLRASGALTMSAWIYPTNIGSGYPGIIVKRVSYDNQQAYDMYIDPDGRIYVDVQSLDNRFATNTVFQNNIWYHVSVVFDGALPADQRVRVYVNGVLDITAPETSSTIEPYTSNLSIGSLPNGGSIFAGTIDEVAIWTRALSAAEIAGLASATSPI